MIKEYFDYDETYKGEMELKIYKYDSQRYFVAVTLTTVFMFLILIFAVVNNIKDSSFNIYSLCIIVTVYGLYNNLISLSNPNKIFDDDKKVSFYAFGRTHSYLWDDIKYARVKEFYGRKIYLRLDSHNSVKGRYWIKTAMYNDGDELYQKFTELERKLHPNLLKFNNIKIDELETDKKR